MKGHRLAWGLVCAVAVAGCATMGFDRLSRQARKDTCRTIASGLDWGEVSRCAMHGMGGVSGFPMMSLREDIRLDVNVLVSREGHVRRVELVSSPQPVAFGNVIGDCLTRYLYNEQVPDYAAEKSVLVPVTLLFSAQPPDTRGEVRYSVTPQSCTVQYVPGRPPPTAD